MGGLRFHVAQCLHVNLNNISLKKPEKPFKINDLEKLHGKSHTNPRMGCYDHPQPIGKRGGGTGKGGKDGNIYIKKYIFPYYIRVSAPLAPIKKIHGKFHKSLTGCETLVIGR